MKDGVYTIRSVKNTKGVLEAAGGGTINGTKVQLYSSNGTDSQGWKVSHDDKGYVTFKNVKSGLALDLSSGSSNISNGVKVQLYTPNETLAQKWIVKKNGNHYEIVSAVNPEYSIELAGGKTSNKTLAQVYESNGTEAQKWTFDTFKTQGNTADSLAQANKDVMSDGYYIIKPLGNLNFGLEIKGGSYDDLTNVQLYTLNDTASQVWKVSHDQKGYVYFTNGKTGKYLSIKNNALLNNQNIVQTSEQTDAAKWIISNDQQGRIIIISGINIEYVLDVYNGVYANQTPVVINKSVNKARQNWVFQPINFDPSTNEYAIMGASNITASQLVRYYNTYKGSASYDKFSGDNSKYNGVLAKGGASTIEEFCQIYYEECLAEGVKPEVAFAQSMLETGFLKFGGDVLPNQYNFAGLGATGNGVHGNSFSSVRIGIRAHIQHLKCYASTAPLNQEKVDPRWSDSLRGKAPTVEKLQGTWATSTTYASSLLKAIERIKTV